MPFTFSDLVGGAHDKIDGRSCFRLRVPPEIWMKLKKGLNLTSFRMLHHFVFGHGGSMAARSGRTFKARRFKQRAAQSRLYQQLLH